MSQPLVAARVTATLRAPRRVAAEVAEVVAPLVRRPRADVALAVHEAVANAVLHGGPPIEVEAVRTPDGVEVRVVDAGRRVPPVSRPADERGRGSTLMAASCDRLLVEQPRPGGRRVRLGYLGRDLGQHAPGPTDRR